MLHRLLGRKLLGVFVLEIVFAAASSGAAARPAGTVAPKETQLAQAVPSADASAISGSVRDDAGRGVGNVRISVAGATPASTTTSADGTFTFSGLAAGTYLITAERAGYATVSSTITLATAGTQKVAFTLGTADQTTLRQIGRVVTSRSNTELNRTPAAVNTIDQQAYIQRGAPQVSNLLEELPGVELQRFSSGGGPGANTVAALRGADPAETQILIDGHPVSGGPEGNYLLQFLNPLLLNDIEVSKGPGTLGNQINNQVNGSINFRTPSITPHLSGLVTLGYDTYNGSTDSLRVSDTIGKFGFLVGYAQFGTPGYNTSPVLDVAANANAGLGVIPDATATLAIPASQTFHNHSELLKLGYNFSNSTALTLGYIGLHTYADYTSNLTTEEPFHIVASCPNAAKGAPSGPGTGMGCSRNSFSGLTSFTNPSLLGLVGQTVYASSTDDNLYLGNFENDNEPFFTADLRTTLGPGSFLGRYYAASIARNIDGPAQVHQPYQCDDPTCSAAVIGTNMDFQKAYFQTQSDYLHGADFEYAIPVGPNTYTASYDTHGDRTSSCSGGSANPSNCSVPSVLQTSQTIGVRSDLHFGRQVGVQAASYFSHTTFVGSRADPRIGVTFEPNANVVVRAAAGSSFVAPSAQTAYDVIPHVDRKTLYTGPAIRPETAVSYDLGSDVRTGTDSKLALDIYATRLFNRFNTVSITSADGGTIGTLGGLPYNKISTTGNQATALQKGIELTYTKAPRFGFGTIDYFNFLRAFAGGSDTALDANGNPIVGAIGTIYGNVADGTQFNGYPYSHGRAELNYTTRSSVRSAVGASYYGAINSFNEPGFVSFDANVQALLKGDLQLNLSVANIFNHDAYRTFGVYNYGTALPALGGGVSNSTLFFAPPRLFTVQLIRAVGRPNP